MVEHESLGLYKLPRALARSEGTVHAPRYVGGYSTPRADQIEGHAKLRLYQGWTLLAFWDRSGDDRYGSASMIAARGCYGFDEMIMLLDDTYPRLAERLDKAGVRIRLDPLLYRDRILYWKRIAASLALAHLSRDRLAELLAEKDALIAARRAKAEPAD